MATKRTREQLKAKWLEFHRANPLVWEYYVRFALEAKQAGVRILGISLLTERIRWEIGIVTRSSDGFKINNNHRAFYSRKLNRDPRFEGMFTTRKQSSKKVAEKASRKHVIENFQPIGKRI